MTTNDATPREAIAEADEWMYENGHEMDERGKIARCIDKHGFDWGWDDATILGAADEVIAHLWSRGTDWDTAVVKVACILEDEVKCDVAPDSYHGKLEDMADEIVATLLTALIGPKPTIGFDISDETIRQVEEAEIDQRGEND